MDNIGSLHRIRISPADNIDSVGNIISTDNLKDIPFIIDTARRKCSRKEDKNGIYYDLEIECSVARTDTAEYILSELPERFVLITTDNNNIIRLDGTPEEPLHYTAELDSGEKFESLNYCKFKFNRKLRRPSLIIT